MIAPLEGAFRTPPAARPGAFFMVEGRGFATGRLNRVRIDALNVPERWLTVGARRARCLDAQEFQANGRCSRAGDTGPLEHVSAGLGIAGMIGWHLRAEHFDLPLLDGSAQPWYDGARRIVSGRVPSHSWKGAPVEEHLEGERRGVLSARQADDFRLDVRWSTGPDGGEQWCGGVQDLSRLVRARTFVDVDTFIESRRHGEMGGADMASGRLLRGLRPVDESVLELASQIGVDPRREVWVGGDERVPCECAAHKALDLVGDILLWLGYLPSLHIVACDAGHALHHRLGARLRRLATSPRS